MIEPAGAATGTLSFGPFTVTPHERLVTRDGVALPLGAKAFDTLIALMSRPNQVVGKWDLMALVWPGVTVEEANLRFQVAALRKALGDGKDGARYITTLSGRGYCFVAPIAQREIQAERRPTPRAELPPVKLPNRLQRMVGRDDVVAAVSDRLISSRFVTIVGPGGVGKTAVAVAIAHDLLETFSDAAHFVDLAALSDPDLVITSILLMLGLPAQTDDPLPALLTHLRDKRMLLILDNCEHVVAAAAPLAAEIFHAAPNVHILATSREALRVEGEQVYRLAPLAVPPDNPGLTAAIAQSYPALQLFLERAMSGGAQIALDDANATIVAGICRKLDGMALAIELAAGRVEPTAWNKQPHCWTNASICSGRASAPRRRGRRPCRRRWTGATGSCPIQSASWCGGLPSSPVTSPSTPRSRSCRTSASTGRACSMPSTAWSPSRWSRRGRSAP